MQNLKSFKMSSFWKRQSCIQVYKIYIWTSILIVISIFKVGVQNFPTWDAHSIRSLVRFLMDKPRSEECLKVSDVERLTEEKVVGTFYGSIGEGHLVLLACVLESLVPGPSL